MVEMKDGLAKIVKMPPLPIVSRQAAPRVLSLSPAVFAIKRDILWKVQHWSQARMKIVSLPRERAVDIDTEIDFELVNLLINRAKRAF
jgi:N-acylneuraminate cytidylyltransferase/CMP-N,N'-diacetyllegionaminic acid synthase